MSTYNISLTEEVYNVSVTTQEVVSVLNSNVDVYNVSVSEDCYSVVYMGEESYSVVNTVSVYKVNTSVEEVYNVSVVMTGGGGSGSSDIGDLYPAGSFENQLITWSVSLGEWRLHPSDVLDSTSIGGSGVPEYFLCRSTSPSDGYISVSSAGSPWNTSKAIIKSISISTDSTDWDLWVHPVASGGSGVALPKQVMGNGYQGESITLDYAYEDEDSLNEIHLQLINNTGPEAFSIQVICTELQ